MKKVVIMLFLGVVLFTATSTAFAHGGEDGEVDAPTYVRQAIAFLEGTNNVEAAKERVQDALQLPSEGIHQEVLLQAQKALDNANPEEAKILLVKALGIEPNGAEELALHTGFNGDLGNYIVLLLGVISIIAGGLIIRKNKSVAAQKGGIIHG